MPNDLLALGLAVDLCLPGNRVTVTAGDSVRVATHMAGTYHVAPVQGLPDNYTVSVLTRDDRARLVLAPSIDEPVPLLRVLTYIHDEIAQGLRMSLLRPVD